MTTASTQNTRVTINFSLNLNADNEGHNVYYILNRIRTNCRRIAVTQTSSDLIDSFRTIYNTTLNLERAMFAADQLENISIMNHLRSCYETLRFLMPSFIEQMSQDDSSTIKFSNVLHVVFLVFCDLHLIEGLEFAIYHFKPDLDNPTAIVYELSQTLQENIQKSVQKRQQQLVTKAQITLPTPKSIRKVTYDDMKQLVDETFIPLTNKLVPQSRKQLASIIAFDECLCSELRKLMDQLERVKSLSADQAYASRSKLAFLMERIDKEINQFIQEHFSGEFPLENPRLSNITSSINISPPVDGKNQHKEDHVANSNSTNAGSPSYPMAEDDVTTIDEDLDSFDLSEFMEPSAEPDLEYTNPPLLLLQTIDRLCNENGIRDAVWSLSTREPNLIVVNGKGITDERKVELEQAMRTEFADFQTEFINVELCSQNLTGLVLHSTCNRHSPSPRWEPHEKATCEILLTGQQPHRSNREVVYAVTSAHLLLFKEEMIELENVDDSLQQLKLEVSRDEVNKRIGEHVYSFSPRSANGTLPLTVNLCNPALLAFRTCQHAAPSSDASQSDTKRYDCMSDIALIPMESGNEQLMREWFKSTNMNLIEGIHHFKPGQFEKFIASKAKVYAQNREGKAIPLPTDVNPTTSKPRAIHLPFVLTKGERFQPGDSGSLIYARLGGSDNRRLAIGILKGSRPPPEDHVFEAILLKSAMEDLEHDYRHLVNSLKLYKGCQARKSGSTGPVPVKTAHKT